MDQGMLFLLIAVAVVVVVLGGYVLYLRRRGLAARLSLDFQAAGKPADRTGTEVGVETK